LPHDPQQNLFATNQRLQVKFVNIRSTLAIKIAARYQATKKTGAVVLSHRHSSSASRRTAGAVGFLTFTQCLDRPFKWTKADAASGMCKPAQVGTPLGREGFARKKLAMIREGRYGDNSQ
jgi:hypothetical protein